MFRKKIVIQDGYKDCGPTCLLMIIKYYKGNVNIEKLKELCQNDKTGTTAYDLIEAAKICGFEANGVKCEIENMTIDNLILPCIAHVTIDDSYNHYVVIYKVDFKNKKIIIGDPAIGYKKYSFDEFKKIYNNILIFLYPIKNIPYDREIKIMEFIKNICRSSKNQLIQIVGISLFITIFSIITSFYLQYMIDNIITDKKNLIFIFIVFLLIYILKLISDFFRNQILILVNQKIDLELTFETFKKIIFLPYIYYRNHPTGEIMSRLTDLNVVRDVISKVAISIFIDLPLTVISLIVLYIINSKLFFIALLMLVLYLIIIKLFTHPLNNLVNNCQQNKAETNSYIFESINGFESIKGNNIEKVIVSKLETKYLKFLKSIAKLDHFYNVQYLLKEIVNNIGFIVIILIGCFLVYDENLTIGTLLSFNALLVYFLNPIRNVIDLDISIKEAKNAIRRVLNILRDEENNGIYDLEFTGEIKITNLNYKFGSKEILSNVNTTIKSGSKVVVIGNSGGGKSTLFKIIKKYYPVARNKIYINDIDINDYKKSDVIYISQNEILFTDTIKNNIGSIDNLTNVSKICLIDEIVADNNLGYNMLLEENGFNISGGEKQRIILARSINRPFNILIIDEGLSQVDTNMERKILKNLFESFEEKTIIFISHRLDNIDLFDQIIEIQNGRLVKDVRRNNG